MPRLENWSVIKTDLNPYAPPEQQFGQLRGAVYGHPKHGNGTIVHTSWIIDANGKHVKTISGTIYELGKISTEYFAFVLDNKIPFDFENPIRVVKD